MCVCLKKLIDFDVFVQSVLVEDFSMLIWIERRRRKIKVKKKNENKIRRKENDLVEFCGT